MKTKHLAYPAYLAAALVALSGCASKPDNYYTLASPVAAADAAPGTPVDIDLFGTWSCGKVVQEPVFAPKDDH